MAVAYDSDGVGSITGPGTDVVSHIINSGIGQGRIMVFFIETYDTGGTANLGATAVSYGGASATLLASQDLDDGTDYHRMEIYYILDDDLRATSGSSNVSISIGSCISGRFGWVVMTGAREEVPMDWLFTTETGTDTSITSGLIPVGNDGAAVVDGLFTFDDTLTRTTSADAAQTKYGDISGNGSGGDTLKHLSTSTKEGLSAGSTTTSWTISSTGASLKILAQVSLRAIITTTDVVIEDGYSGGNSTNSPSWSHFLNADTDFVVVGVSLRGNNPISISSVTFNGTSMNLLVSDSTSGGFQVQSALYYLPNSLLPGTRNTNYTVQVTSTGGQGCNGFSLGLSNVDQDGPYITDSSQFEGSTQSLKTNITPIVTNSLLVHQIAADNGTSTAPGTAETEIYDRSDNNMNGSAYYRGCGPAELTSMGSILGGSANRWVTTIVAIPPVGIGGPDPQNVSFYGCWA